MGHAQPIRHTLTSGRVAPIQPFEPNAAGRLEPDERRRSIRSGRRTLLHGLRVKRIIMAGLEMLMTAFNAVRFRVKPGRDTDFLAAHEKMVRNWPGFVRGNLIKTGERTYCIIAEWTDMDSLVKARPNMIASLDSFRDALEDLGGGLGVTDPVSGPVVLTLT